MTGKDLAWVLVRIALRTNKENAPLEENQLRKRRERKGDVDEDTRGAERRRAR